MSRVPSERPDLALEAEREEVGDRFSEAREVGEDCNRALDMTPGKYRFGPQQNGTWFTSDGKVGWADQDSLASSVSGMAHMVRHMHQSANVPLTDVVRMASLTPAERVGMDSQIGSLQRGKRADIVVLSRRLKVKSVFLGGIRFNNAVRR